MNYRWQISKYDPRFRDASGRYTRDEWTAASDIGTAFRGNVLSVDEYLATEDRYIQSIQAFIAEAEVGGLTVTSLEKSPPDPARRPLFPRDLPEGIAIENGVSVMGENLEKICRAILREIFWCELNDGEKFQIHFGYDYYVTIASKVNCPNAVIETRNLGLFVKSQQRR